MLDCSYQTFILIRKQARAEQARMNCLYNYGLIQKYTDPNVLPRKLDEHPADYKTMARHMASAHAAKSAAAGCGNTHYKITHDIHILK
jgi:hypothetical protein